MSVLVHGPASWNRLVLLDRLPAPVPHTVFADRSWETVGGTSAGKALGLAALGRRTVLCTQLANDDVGDRVRGLLEHVGVRVRVTPSEVTERHLNLMTPRGERLSIFLEQPPASRDGSVPGPGDTSLSEAMAAADVLVLDLSPESRRLLPVARATGRPIWVDLHDYDGRAAFHQPFLEAADAIFLNDDATDDPFGLLRACLRFGASFAVCTLGADGAIALDASGRRHRVPAVPVPVVDTNGAGDAFFAGALHAHLDGADLPQMLAAGAAHASGVLGSRHLHPALDALLGAP
ncbi:carbohydrate kinase family protein [Nocardioides sp.]|uniref:carbohydrate kinase family protein n=1 Tax=Nocardioides sp. TaxID=35761 RepID=UPI002B5C8E20|nr:carbohydrate kinase family protein [Nocardioides sp.]HSX68640.1 carbohydrate kinase family protein [Nocardioides sp.]